MNMFHGDRWIFVAPDPAVVDTDLTTDMKRTLITEKLRSPGISHRLVSVETLAYRIPYEPSCLHP
jgi:hypothetical protein